MGYRPGEATIERKDNNKGYSPGNCVWADRTTNARNKRNSRMITAFGKTQCLSAWAEERGIHWATIRWRLVEGKQSPEQALRK